MDNTLILISEAKIILYLPERKVNHNYLVKVISSSFYNKFVPRFRNNNFI